MSPTPNLLFKPAARVSDSALCQRQSEQGHSANALLLFYLERV